MLACLFQMSSACLAKTHASPDCLFPIAGKCKVKATFSRKLPSCEVSLIPSSPPAGPSLLRKKDRRGIVEGERNSLPKANMWTGKISLFLAIQRSWLASPPRTPNASFLVIILLSSFFFHSPCDSVSVSHSFCLVPLLHPARLTQGPGMKPRRLSSLWPIIGECREVFGRAAELISYLNTTDSRARQSLQIAKCQCLF